MGIWKAVKKDGKSTLTRDVSLLEEWKYWANKNEISEKSGQRIVFLGESVARGYFLDPFFTPADSLGNFLNVDDAHRFDIVDLARVNMNLAELSELFFNLDILEPDAVVIFAGNNWLTDLYNSFETDDIAALSSIIATCQLAKLKLFLEGKFRNHLTKKIARIVHEAECAGLPLIFIIPEFNLKDWHDEECAPNVYFLTDASLARWTSLSDEAKRAMEAGDYPQAIAAAEGLISLDSTNSAGHKLCGMAWFATGNIQKAKDCFRNARDCSILFRKVVKPRTLGLVREVLLGFSSHPKVTMIDLQEIFETLASGGLPDRSLFFDYCHLSVTGIEIAMKETALVIQKILCNKPGIINSASFQKEYAKPKTQTIGKAHLFAAIHNAHFGQDAEIVRFHCEKALELEAGNGAFVSLFCELATLKCPNDLCSAYRELQINFGVDQYFEGLDHEPGKKIMDIVLVDAMLQAMLSRDGLLHRRVAGLRESNHAIKLNETVDLLEAYYSRVNYNEQVAGERNYYHTSDLTSLFYLITGRDEKVDMLLVLTCRVPFVGKLCSKVRVEINGENLCTFSVSDSWKKLAVRVKKSHLKEGVNQVKICWPLEHRKLDINGIMSTERLHDFLSPTLGEIQKFTVTGVESTC